jgi:DNA polymerase-3 subunit gamma/tau
MTLLRMLAFRPLEGSTQALAAGAPPATRGAPARTPQGAASSAAVTASAAPTTAPAAASASRPSQPGVRDEPPSAALPTSSGGSDVDWAQLLQNLDLRGPARQLADNCDLHSTKGGAWQLVLPPDKEHLHTQQLRSRLENALREHLGQDIKVSIVTGTPVRPTPAELRRANENERMRAARESIENDPNVKAVQAAFDATLEADSIRSAK